MNFNTTYYLAKSNKTCEVNVEFQNTDIVITAIENNSELITFPITDAILSAKLGNLPRELSFTDASKLIIPNEVALAAYFPSDTSDDFLHFIEQKKLAWLVAAILVPLSLYFIVATLIPSAAKSVAPLLSHEQKIKIDQQLITTFDYIMLEPSALSEQNQIMINDQWQNIVNTLKVPEGKYRLLLRKSNKLGANAFALPGGTLVVTDELFMLLKDNKNALAAVLLHEMGHVEHHHSMQMIAETTASSLLMTYFLGDLDGMVEIFSGSALTLLQNSFSRALEQEADQYALSQLQVMNISPDAFAQALTALAKGNTESELLEKYFSSHPLIKERIEKAKSEAKSSEK
jgi:Zn-dependent protease with chaperone function